MSKSSKTQKKPDIEAPAACSSLCLTGLVSLLEEHRANISADFKTTFAVLESRLDTIQAKVSDHEQHITSLETSAELHDQRIQILEENYAALAESHAKLQAKIIDLESRSRRNNIRITGLPESIEGPRPTAFFSELLREVFGQEILQSPPELDRAHRALTAKPSPGSRPRPVIIRIHRYQTKELIIREARKRRGKLQYRGSPVQVFEDYAPEVVEERAKYRAVMSELYNLALKPALLFPARLQITLDGGVRKRFSSPQEAAAFAASYQQSQGPD